MANINSPEGQKPGREQFNTQELENNECDGNEFNQDEATTQDIETTTTQANQEVSDPELLKQIAWITMHIAGIPLLAALITLIMFLFTLIGTMMGTRMEKYGNFLQVDSQKVLLVLLSFWGDLLARFTGNRVRYLVIKERIRKLGTVNIFTFIPRLLWCLWPFLWPNIFTVSFGVITSFFVGINIIAHLINVVTGAA